MNREIKFRAWNGSQMSSNTITIQELAIKEISWDADKLIWLQYTGIKDKDGREIYEGDILKDINWNYIYITKFGYVLSIPFTGWYASPLKSGYETCALNNDSGSNINQQCVIIGNIYENPELI